MRSKDTSTFPDYRRSLVELAAFQQVQEKELPLLAICRGAQLGNTFFGGKLTQHVDNQYAEQFLETADQELVERLNVEE